jgi:hypothetical protein
MEKTNGKKGKTVLKLLMQIPFNSQYNEGKKLNCMR